MKPSDVVKQDSVEPITEVNSQQHTIDDHPQSMWKNIEILAVFVAIVTMFFGAMHLIQRAVDVLKHTDSMLVLVLVLTALLASLSVTIMLLMRWIQRMKNPNVIASYRGLIRRIILALLVFSFIMGLGLYNHHKKNMQPHHSHTTAAFNISYHP